LAKQSSNAEPNTKKIIYKQFNALLNHIRKCRNHATLKSGRSITKTKWHSPKGKSIKGTCKIGLVLVQRCYENLGVARVSIQKANYIQLTS